MARFPRVHGDLFDGAVRIPDFDTEMRRALLDAGQFDWTAISPAIFGALFQSVMELAERRAQGAHYTTEKNILKVIEPLFLDDLRAEFRRLQARRDGRVVADLRTFRDKLGSLRLFDPACGCGNFLIIAYRELRTLEIDLLREIASRGSAMFVNLHRFPRSGEAVQDVVAAIRNRRIDEVGSVSEDLVRAGDWSPVQWYDPKLAEAAGQIRQAPGLSQLTALYDMEPAGQRIRDAFEQVTDGSSTGADVDVFDSVSSDLRVSLASAPDAAWRPRPGKESMVRSYLARMGWALLTNRARVNNARLVAVCAAAKGFGSGFISYP